MATAKEIKQRIRSIKNTQKTTKAMELVSGAKMRKAVQSAVNARSYYKAAWTIASRIRNNAGSDVDTDLLSFFQDNGKTTEPQKTTVVMFTSNRGLCGAFNSNVTKKVINFVQENGGNEFVEVIAVGKKGVATLNSIGIKTYQAYDKDDTAQDDSSVREVAAYLYDHFKRKSTDRVMVAYTEFVSPMEQNAEIKQLYPFTKEGFDKSVQEEIEDNLNHVYTYEPSPTAVLNFLIPRIAEVELYQALLESNASEHSARMLAMKNASEAAGEMSQELKLVYNRARQAAITQEIAEIAAGSAAVS